VCLTHGSEDVIGAAREQTAGELLAEVAGVLARAPDHVADQGLAVEVGDEAVEHESVTFEAGERANGHLAAAFEGGKQRALGGYLVAGVGVVERRQEVGGVDVFPAFDGERALAGRRQEDFGLEDLGDVTLEAEAR